METKRIRRQQQQQQQQQPSPGTGSHEPKNEEGVSSFEEGASQAGPERKPLWGSVRPPVALAGFLLMLLPLIAVIYSRTPSLDWICNCRSGRVEGRAESFEATSKHGLENCSFASSNITKANILNENVTKNDFLQKNDTKSDFLQKNVTEDHILQKNVTDDNVLQKNVTENNILQKSMTKDNILPKDVPKDKLLGGLLAAGFDEGSCLSRYQSVLYRKESLHIPSPYLLEKLRKHEALQKRCGPNTELYNKAIKQLKPLGKREKRKQFKLGYSNETTECSYLTLIPFSGLGNRIVSLTSAFLYALLTNRVLLVDGDAGIGDLFCEPFPDTSWLLPQDFPARNQFRSLGRNSPECLGSMLKNKVIGNGINGSSNGPLSPYVLLYLVNGYSDFDQLFFCEDVQRPLQTIPWLVVRSNQYFAPALFFIPTFEEELSRLFPERETVFHHLGRYLFHPTNPVWGLITRSYESYLAKADERVGLQIRVFNGRTSPVEYLDRILKCALKEKLLPNISPNGPAASTSTGARSKVVLITSLDSTYFEKVRSMYWEHPTVTGEIISVYQPSHEGVEQTGKTMHEMRAWAEIYLLSLSDALVTSTWSTFGYVAQGLAGLKPLITLIPDNPDCRGAMSMEPCFHFPPFYGCKANTSVDAGAVLPYVRHCEDMKNGLKLVGLNEH